MAKTKRKKGNHEGIRLQGFARVQICEYGPDGEPNARVVSDTGYVGPNVITNVGLWSFNLLFGNDASGSYPRALGLGSSAADPTAASTALGGENNNASWPRCVATYSLVSSSKAQWIGSWGSAANSGSGQIGCVGMYGSSGTGSLLFGKSTPAQTWATNQSVNVTYQMTFS